MTALPIDLRSDTVTQPSPAMRTAMYQAEVGDDVFGDDPTVNRLEARAAALLGKEAALFVPSGTMGNLCAILTHCRRGDELIAGTESHIRHAEAGGASVLGGVAMWAIPNAADGTLPLDAVAAAIRPIDHHFPHTALICVENTQNRCGGVPLSVEYMTALGALARRHEVPVHLDGARIFNAAVAGNTTAAALAGPAASVMFCLSKGLAAPVGSLLCGAQAFIDRARFNRKLVGGGMRQAGILAAAGLVALNEMVDRLAEDHANAGRLARGLAQIPGLQVDPRVPHTNMVYATVTAPGWTADRLTAAYAAAGVLIGPSDPQVVRLVTHYGITAPDIDTALTRIAPVLAALRA
ncbi:MAG TPA: low-specificity L-threonine aldolase [Chloroflexia bacterium]|nr:low-specificity L-threonine aldolase [Chloroflexia bacterium]